MASLSTDKTGNVSIYVTLADGRRRPIRLGKAGRQRAERIRSHMSELERALKLRIEPAIETRAWLVSEAGELMPQKSTFFYPKLANGLVINPLE